MYCMKPPIKEPPEGRCGLTKALITVVVMDFMFLPVLSVHLFAQVTGAVECATSKIYYELSELSTLTNLSLADQFYSLVNGDLCHYYCFVESLLKHGSRIIITLIQMCFIIACAGSHQFTIIYTYS